MTLSSIVNGQEREKVPEIEIKEVIEIAIELPELQQYFHVDKDSTRIPLRIKEFGTVNSKNLKGLQKFGVPNKVIEEKSIKEENIDTYLNIGDWTYGGNNLRLQMDYSIEGITINMRLNRINGKAIKCTSWGNLELRVSETIGNYSVPTFKGLEYSTNPNFGNYKRKAPYYSRHSITIKQVFWEFCQVLARTSR